MNRKIVAFTCLTFPYTLSAEQQAIAKDEQPPPEGHNPALAAEFFECLESAKKYGYDPIRDFRASPLSFPPLFSPSPTLSFPHPLFSPPLSQPCERTDPECRADKKGTMVHPAYQRLGLGTWLTKHCNAIADAAGGRTFVLARPSSKHLFENLGFKVLGSEDLDLVRYGGKESEGRAWVLVREPGVEG